MASEFKVKSKAHGAGDGVGAPVDGGNPDFGVEARIGSEGEEVGAFEVYAQAAHAYLAGKLPGQRVTQSQVLKAQVRSVFDVAVGRAGVVVGVAVHGAGHGVRGAGAGPTAVDRCVLVAYRGHTGHVHLGNVEDGVAIDSLQEEGQVEVLVAQGVVERSDEFGLGISYYLPVVLVYHSVSGSVVSVGEPDVAGLGSDLGGVVVYVFLGLEYSGRFPSYESPYGLTHHVGAEVLAEARVVVVDGLGLVQGQDLVLVEGDVEISSPVEVVLYDIVRGENYFHTHVAYLALVGVGHVGVGIARADGDRHLHQHTVRVLDVGIDVQAQAGVQEGEVKAQVVLLHLLPVDVGVGELVCHQRIHDIAVDGARYDFKFQIPDENFAAPATGKKWFNTDGTPNTDADPIQDFLDFQEYYTDTRNLGVDHWKMSKELFEKIVKHPCVLDTFKASKYGNNFLNFQVTDSTGTLSTENRIKVIRRDLLDWMHNDMGIWPFDVIDFKSRHEEDGKPVSDAPAFDVHNIVAVPRTYRPFEIKCMNSILKDRNKMGAHNDSVRTYFVEDRIAVQNVWQDRPMLNVVDCELYAGPVFNNVNDYGIVTVWSET